MKPMQEESFWTNIRIMVAEIDTKRQSVLKVRERFHGRVEMEIFKRAI